MTFLQCQSYILDLYQYNQCDLEFDHEGNHEADVQGIELEWTDADEESQRYL
jgi:hypothetical protein